MAEKFWKNDNSLEERNKTIYNAFMNILVCEDQKILLDTLYDSLNKSEDINIVAKISKASNIISQLQNYSVDLILTDIITDNNENALDYIPKIKNTFPQIKIVTITGFPDISFVKKAKSFGVDSFVYKNISIEQLVNVLRNTMDGYNIYPAKSGDNPSILSSLTPTELRVLRMYCNGLERVEIMEKLGISQSSLKSHISSILNKTGYPSIARVAIYAVKNGLILTENA